MSQENRPKLGHGAWIVVADGERARFYVNAGTEHKLRLELAREKEIENPPTREQGTDKPGRFDDAGIGRSAVDNTDWHAQEKERFAEELAEELRKAALTGRFDQLFVAAPAKTLGILRDNLHKEVQRRLIADLNKELTNHPLAEVEAIIGQVEP
ncbi:MAG: host attachment protein [Geminicoccaceae bacterium]